MRKQLENKLYNDFPNLYRQRNLSIQESCMPWGFECGDGWFDIIYQLSKNITDLDPDVQAVQVKEKWGELRFYINGGTNEVYDLIDEATELSLKTCEECGTRENVTTNDCGWVSTLCDKCR